ncbi:DUF3263 domain-containing protein [Micromonospora sp. KC721]|uniref:DUF3263 domain-containing protein n=1 Tax=Micromonospora sp. KC721 TaxID=2530380 RepID=UPI0010449560|nr:DUF3263 domain-containing protein [Micromonospora sp. KC721]TDB71691.1 DUF3263 domain-containing protein [Micromonospora sp. KC721]
MPPADAVPADVDRPEPPPTRAGTDVTGRAVPPPRSVPEVEITSGESAPRAGAASGTAGTGDAAVAAGLADAAGSTAGAGVQPDEALTEREQRILAFERQWWRHAGAKEQAIRDTFGLSATRYYQLLNALLDRPAALAAEPLLVGRLRRLRASRARTRRR